MRTRNFFCWMIFFFTLVCLIVGAKIRCKEEQLNCSTLISDPKLHFMAHGELFSGKGFEGIWLARVNNSQNWDYNQYFTGSGWSTDKSNALNGDSCSLKQSYFEYLENINE